MSLEEPILNIFNHEKKLVKADDLYFTFKKKHFSSACTSVLEKYSNFFFKNAKFWFFDFRQNIHLEVVLITSKLKVMLPDRCFFCLIGFFFLRKPYILRPKNKFLGSYFFGGKYIFFLTKNIFFLKKIFLIKNSIYFSPKK